jgi:hypothetical protein
MVNFLDMDSKKLKDNSIERKLAILKKVAGFPLKKM